MFAEPAAALRQLDDAQLEAFDEEFVTGPRLDQATGFVEADFGHEPFAILDIGGGNGAFVDRLLNRFPAATATLVDNSELLLSRNKPHPRKTLVNESATNLRERFRDQRFDLICMNWILHHLVVDSYRKTRELQVATLDGVRKLLTPRGRIHLLECIYEGLILPALPGWLIYQITGSRLLAPLARKLGANTAGCGVCFLSHAQWARNFERASLGAVRTVQHPGWNPSWIHRVGLQLRTAHHGQYWLGAVSGPSPSVPGVLGCTQSGGVER